MTSKTFVSGTTIDSAWLNDVNDSTYTADTAPVGSFRASLESSSGSSLVGYLPAGTGAVATDVQSKLQESVSVTDFGAIGSTRFEVPTQAVMEANTAAFNEAVLHVLSIGGGEIIVPNQVFHTYGTIDINLDSYAASFANYSRPIVKFRGVGSATIYQNHPTAPLIRNEYVPLRISTLCVAGRGSTTTGNLIELTACQYWVLDTVDIRGTAGRGLYVNGSERGTARNLFFYLLRQAIVHGSGANNETYYYNTVILSPGETQDPVTGSNRAIYGLNPQGGVAGTYTQEKRAAVDFYDFTNNRYVGGSIKALYNCAGIRVRGGESNIIQNIYFEGFVTGAINPSIIFGGTSEATTTTSAITALDTSIPVGDDKWFINKTSSARQGAFSAVVKFVIYDPADVTTYEVVGVQYFLDGVASVVTRGQNGTTALAWASGVVIREWLGATPITNLSVYDNHLEGYQALPAASTLNTTVALGQTQGEIILGNTWDEFHRSVTQVPVNNYLLYTKGNRTRNFGETNSGKIQTWGGGSDPAIVEYGPGHVPVGTNGIVQSDSTIGSATFSNYDFISSNYRYRPVSSGNLPWSLDLTSQSTANFGGNGFTSVVSGERGIAFAVESTKATELATVNAKTFSGFKYQYYSGGIWYTGGALTQRGFRIGDAGLEILHGAGSPEGVMPAKIGSLYLRSDGGAGTSLYVKESGTGNTGWVGK